MTPTLDEIIRLCDIPWLQERYARAHGSISMYHKPSKHISTYSPTYKDLLNAFLEQYIYLPLNFDPEKCMNQLDVLLVEAGEFEEEWMMFDSYEDWRCERSRKQDYVSNNETIAKLTWLHELIERRGDA